MTKLLSLILAATFAAVSITPAVAAGDKDQKKEQKQQDKKGTSKKDKK